MWAHIAAEVTPLPGPPSLDPWKELPLKTLKKRLSPQHRTSHPKGTNSSRCPYDRSPVRSSLRPTTDHCCCAPVAGVDCSGDILDFLSEDRAGRSVVAPRQVRLVRRRSHTPHLPHELRCC